MIQSSPRASLVNLYSSVVICNSTEGSTLTDFLHTCTLNCREKSDEFQESSKRMASECDITSEQYRRICSYTLLCLLVMSESSLTLVYIRIHNNIIAIELQYVASSF